jgi:hypothetical protein
MRLIFFILINVCLESFVSLGQKKDIFILLDRSQGEKILLENYIEKKESEQEIVFEKGIGCFGNLGIDYFMHNPKMCIKKHLSKDELQSIYFTTIEEIEKGSVYREWYKNKISEEKNELIFFVMCFNVFVVELRENKSYVLYEVNWFRSFNIE